MRSVRGLDLEIIVPISTIILCKWRIPTIMLPLDFHWDSSTRFENKIDITRVSFSIWAHFCPVTQNLHGQLFGPKTIYTTSFGPNELVLSNSAPYSAKRQTADLKTPPTWRKFEFKKRWFCPSVPFLNRSSNVLHFWTQVTLYAIINAHMRIFSESGQKALFSYPRVKKTPKSSKNTNKAIVFGRWLSHKGSKCTRFGA